MQIDKLLMGLLVFTAIVVGGVLIIGDLNNNYDGIMQESINTSDFGDVYNTTDKIYNISEDMKGSIFGGSLDEDDASDSMFKGGYRTLRFIQGSFELIGDIINAIAIKMGVPGFFITLSLTAFIIGIIFGIVYLVFRVAKG